MKLLMLGKVTLKSNALQYCNVSLLLRYLYSPGARFNKEVQPTLS